MSKKRIPDKLKCMYQSAYNDWEGMAERAYAAEARAEAAERRIQELEAAQAWRSIKDEEPESGSWCLCATSDGKVGEAEYIRSRRTGDRTWWWGDGYQQEVKNVTHWRPLPEPPSLTESVAVRRGEKR